ncbi:3' terminal RNA ribose 2'-O-methyltransferase Hen1 [Intrasporangium mesophilum]
MLLTLTATSAPGFPVASDLGFLLHKHPDRVQSFESSVGVAHVFYPESTAQRCSVALLLEVDPVGLVRNKRFGADGFALAQYVNDRPYAASSLLAVALGRVFGTAMKGRCSARPDLEGARLTLEVKVPAVPARRGGPDLVRALFEPLGWDVEARPIPLDRARPEWGLSEYVDLTLRGEQVLADALGHLYVLLPVLDGAKHYWVSPDEVDKLVRTGGGWLGDHPERDLIVHRYLARQSSLAREATERLEEIDDRPAGDGALVDPSLDRRAADGSDDGSGDSFGGAEGVTGAGARAGAVVAGVPLVRLRREAVLSALRRLGARRVVDLGCGEGALLADLVADPSFSDVLGIDVSSRALAKAEKRLRLDRLPDSQRARVRLRLSSVTYRDQEIAGADAVVLMEVIEHVDPDRLPDVSRAVFGHARPAHAVLTTPNADYNVLFTSLPAGDRRHPDHRFEWSRAELAAWAGHVGNAFGYAVELGGIGPEHPDHGCPTQLAVFSRVDVTGSGTPTDAPSERAGTAPRSAAEGVST